MTIFRVLILTLFIQMLTLETALARPTQIKLSGGSASFKLSELTPGEELTVYGVSSGNSSNTIKVRVYGPRGLIVKATAAKVTRSVAATLLTARAFYPISLREGADLQEYHNQCVAFSVGDAFSEEEPPFDPNSIVATFDPICAQYSAIDLTLLGLALTDTYGGTWEPARVCGYVVYVYRGGEADVALPIETPAARLITNRIAMANAAPVSKEFTGLFSKNACGNIDDKYVMRLTIKLPRNFSRTGLLSVRLLETKHNMGKEATIKPVSDGLYAPQPILLMNYLGLCGQRINIVSWDNGKPRKSTPLKVFDLVQYRGLTLTRSPIGALLSGGKGSVELFNKDTGYGACFSLSATRQRVNGYPE